MKNILLAGAMALAGTAASATTSIYSVDWMGVKGNILVDSEGSFEAATCSPLGDMMWFDHYSVHKISNFASDWETLQDVIDDTAAASHSVNYYINNDRADDIYGSLVVRLCYGQNVMQAVMSGEQFVDLETHPNIEFNVTQNLSIADQITLTSALQEWVAEDMDEYWQDLDIAIDYSQINGDADMLNVIANHMNNGTTNTDFPFTPTAWNDSDAYMTLAEAICVWELNDTFGQIHKYNEGATIEQTIQHGTLAGTVLPSVVIPSAISQSNLDPYDFEADILDYGDWGNCIN